MIINDGSSDLTALLFYLFLALPLLYIPGQPLLSRNLRMIFLLGLLFVALFLDKSRREAIKYILALTRFRKILLGIIFIAVLLSSSTTGYFGDTQLIGIAPEYLGLVSWGLFFVLGMLFGKSAINLFLTKTALYIFGGSLVLSLFGYALYFIYGLRLGGVMFQPTTMAMYAVICIILCLHQLSIESKQLSLNIFILVTSMIVVILSQSRLGYSFVILSFIIWGIKYFKVNKPLSLILVLLALMVVLLSQINFNYFIRFKSGPIDRGITYRFELYRQSIPDLLKHELLIGNGPSSVPTAINDRSSVPIDIAQSLDEGYVFLSAHNLFLDFAYFFGCLAALSLILMSGMAIYIYSVNKNRDLTIILIFSVLLGNALLNIPSIELTSMYFVIIFGMFDSSHTRVYKK